MLCISVLHIYISDIVKFVLHILWVPFACLASLNRLTYVFSKPLELSHYIDFLKRINQDNQVQHRYFINYKNKNIQHWFFFILPTQTQSINLLLRLINITHTHLFHKCERHFLNTFCLLGQLCVVTIVVSTIQLIMNQNLFQKILYLY